MSYPQRFIRAIHRSDARAKRIFTVAAATYLGRFVQGIAVLITLPMAKQCLNSELFGFWMMLSALLGFMSFADLGVGNGVLNNLTKVKATGDQQLLRRTLAGGYLITSLVGCLVLLAWVIWSQVSNEPTSIAGAISIENQSQVLRSLSLFTVLLAINIPASLILRVQLGMQQGYLNGLNQMACGLLTIVMVLLTFRWGGSVAELVMATIGVQVFVNTTNSLVWLYKSRAFQKHNRKDLLDSKNIILLLRVGGMFFLLQLAAAFAFQSDVIVITQTLGQSAYGSFAVVQKLFLFISMILGAAMVGLWPAFGDAIAANNMPWARATLFRSAAIAGVIAIFACSALSISMPWIMMHWMNSAVNLDWGLITALSAWTIIDAISMVFAAFMNGANILRAQLVFALGMSLTAFGVKWVLTPILGPSGAVLSTILAYCLISVPGQIYIFKQAFKAKD